MNLYGKYLLLRLLAATMLTVIFPLHAEQNQKPDGILEKSANVPFSILDSLVQPGELKTIEWKSGQSFSGRSVKSPVMVINGRNEGPVLCLVAAIHGDELNGIEIVRRVSQNMEPELINGTIISVPIVNVIGFTSNSRYLPDRRDLNRYFPGNTYGSAASRIAHNFFTKVVSHCNFLVDFHTGSFKRSNLPHLRADMNNPAVREFVSHFGSTVVLHKYGHSKSLRAAANSAGIPTVTFELGQPGSLQEKHIEDGIKTINHLINSLGLLSKTGKEAEPQPVYYKSRWVRVNNGGILFTKTELGELVKTGDQLGTIINPLTNIEKQIVSPVDGHVLGMALNQFMLPGYAAFHIGVSTDDRTTIKDNYSDTEEYSDSEEELD